MFFICTKKQKVHKKHKTSSIVNEVIWLISQAQKEQKKKKHKNVKQATFT